MGTGWDDHLEQGTRAWNGLAFVIGSAAHGLLRYEPIHDARRSRPDATMTSPDNHYEGDEEIVALMRSRNVLGLEALLRVHGGRTKGLLQLAFRLAEGDHCLEDAVCDAGLLVLRQASKLDPSRNLGGYFYVTARRELLRQLKKRRRWHKPLWDGAEEHIAAQDGHLHELCPLAAQVRQVIDTLSDTEREILSLDLANNFTLKASEVALILKTTEATVYSLRNRAKGKLQHLVSGGAERSKAQ